MTTSWSWPARSGASRPSWPRCVSIDLEVPARAEIVLEGEVLAGVAEPEGPYGDFMQFYVPVMPNRVLRLTAITHRRDAIHQTMHAGQAEDTALLALSREAQLLDAVAATGADVRQVSLLPTILAGAISIRKRFEGEPKQVLSAAFGRYRWLKLCVVVDEDVDVLDVSDVWWAITTRSRLGPRGCSTSRTRLASPATLTGSTRPSSGSTPRSRSARGASTSESALPVRGGSGSRTSGRVPRSRTPRG